MCDYDFNIHHVVLVDNKCEYDINMVPSRYICDLPRECVAMFAIANNTWHDRGILVFLLCTTLVVKHIYYIKYLPISKYNKDSYFHEFQIWEGE